MQRALTVPDIDSYLESASSERPRTIPSRAVMTGQVTWQESGKAASISVIYIKLGLDRERLDSYPRQVADYARENARFPQDPTTDQTFTPEQFAAYRDLGHDIASDLDELAELR